MRKNWGLLSLTTLIRLLTSCSIGNSNMRKMFFARNNNQIANEQLEALLEAIQSKNAQAVKELFSDNAWAESGNMGPVFTPPKIMVSIGKATTALMTSRQRRISIGSPWRS